jgi:hypothetical protein
MWIKSHRKIPFTGVKAHKPVDVHILAVVFVLNICWQKFLKSPQALKTSVLKT